MKPSPIAWTDYSGGNLNFVTGCTPVSAGCRECYARRLFERFGRDFSQVTTYPEKLQRLRSQWFSQWSPKRGAPCRPMVFPVDMGDLFHEDVPMAFILDALDVMGLRKDVIWQVLTKRPARMREVVRRYQELNAHYSIGLVWPQAHIWLGVTVEDQQAAEQRIPELLSTPATVRFVSVEPMLGPANLSAWLSPCSATCGADELGPCPGEPSCPDYRQDVLDWVICGAESGPDRRPFDVAWAVDQYEQCRAAGVPFFGKQDSGVTPGTPLELPGIGIVQQWPTQCAVCGGTIPFGETAMFHVSGRQGHMRCEKAFGELLQREGEGGTQQVP